MLYVYAITDTGAPLPGINGLADAPVQEIVHRDVAAVFSSHPSNEFEASERAIWRHEEVVEALMRDRVVLPVRFGVAFGDETILAAEIERRHDALSKSLAHVRGRVELGVRVLEHSPQDETVDANGLSGAPAEGSGRAYMMERLERVQRADDLAREIDERLLPLSVARKHRVLATPRLLLTSAYLVERDSVARFRTEIEALEEVHDDFSFLCSGPWPPYSFVSGELGRE